MRFRMLKSGLVSFVLCFSAMSHAALIDRGNGLIYDTVLGITWLQDANLAATEELGGPDGEMNYADALAFIEYLNTGNYKGFNDWRLPRVLPQDGVEYNYELTLDGSTDYGYNIGLPGTVYAGGTQSEFAHLHFTTLQNESFWDSVGDPNLSCDPSCLNNTGPFLNMDDTYEEAIGYWSGNPIGGDSDNIWTFYFGCGAQCHDDPDDAEAPDLLVWPVRDGDVIVATSVPAVSVWALALLAGLLLLTAAVLFRRAPAE